MIRIRVATDAWYPQVNGVVHTLSEIARVAEPLGATLTFLTPRGFLWVPLPPYPAQRRPGPGAVAATPRTAPAAIGGCPPQRDPCRDRRAERPSRAALLRAQRPRLH